MKKNKYCGRDEIAKEYNPEFAGYGKAFTPYSGMGNLEFCGTAPGNTKEKSYDHYANNLVVSFNGGFIHEDKEQR